MASTSLLPLLIIDRLGPAAAGHYALAWLIGYALYLVSMNMGASLVVETATGQSHLRERCLRSLTHLVKLLVPAVAAIVAAAPYLLALLGPGYARADTGALRLLALSALPALLTNTAISVTRSQRRMPMVAGIQVSICVLVWALSAALMGPLGLTGIGAAWLIAQTVTAAALAARPRLWLPARRAPQPPARVAALWPPRSHPPAATCGGTASRSG
jgi:O-antigen/teichoic acid export membrane protein